MKSHPIEGLTPKQVTWRRVKGTVLIILLLLFALWAGWWWLILLPFLVDFYFTRWVNWRYLREHPNPMGAPFGRAYGGYRLRGLHGVDYIYLLLPELRHPFLIAGEDTPHRRLPLRQ